MVCRRLVSAGISLQLVRERKNELGMEPGALHFASGRRRDARFGDPRESIAQGRWILSIHGCQAAFDDVHDGSPRFPKRLVQDPASLSQLARTFAAQAL